MDRGGLFQHCRGTLQTTRDRIRFFPLTPTCFYHNKKVSDEIILQSNCSITTVGGATSRRAETKIHYVLMVILIRLQKPLRSPMIRHTSYDQLFFQQDSVSREPSGYMYWLHAAVVSTANNCLSVRS